MQCCLLDYQHVRVRITATLIDATDGYRCTGRFRTMEDALARIDADLPDVALVDIGLPELYGRVLITSTDPTKSNSGNMFSGSVSIFILGNCESPSTAKTSITIVTSL